MKEMNRRTFLTLSGASVALLALAACGAPSTPVVPTTGKEDKVLEAIKKYRAAAGVKEQITLDNELKPAMKIVVEIAKGEKKFEDSMGDLSEVMNRYNDLSAPIGIAADKDTGNMMPVCIYLDDVEKMAQNLPLQVDEDTQEKLKSASLIAIQVFEYNGTTFWVALVAKGKKVTP